MIKVTTKQSAKGFVECLKEIFGEKIIPEWRIDGEGDFEPTFTDKGWMRAKVEGENVIKFCYIQRRDRDVTNYSYSTMHCNLAEILLRFLDKEIEDLSISPMLTEDDYIELELIVDNGNQDFDIGDRLYFYRDKYVNENFEEL